MSSDYLLDFIVPWSQSPSLGRLGATQRVDNTDVTVPYTAGGTPGADIFDFNVSDAGNIGYENRVAVNVVPGPTLYTTCRPTEIVLHWSVPDWLQNYTPSPYFYDFRIYRAVNRAPTLDDYYQTVTDPNGRTFIDTGVQAGNTYYYAVTFRHQDSQDKNTYYESPFSNISSSQECSPPEVLITGNNAGTGTIQTYNFADGSLVNSYSWTPQSASDGRGLTIYNGYVYYTENDNTGDIHVCAIGSTTDSRTISNTWRPGVATQDLAFYNGELYILTGYNNEVNPLVVFEIDPASGNVIGNANGITIPTHSHPV